MGAPGVVVIFGPGVVGTSLRAPNCLTDTCDGGGMGSVLRVVVIVVGCLERVVADGVRGDADVNAGGDGTVTSGGAVGAAADEGGDTEMSRLMAAATEDEEERRRCCCSC